MSAKDQEEAGSVQEGSSDPVPDPRKPFVELLDQLFLDAFNESSFDALCTVLRVGGLEGPNWDPFRESSDAFDDYNWMLERVLAQRGERAGRRVGLLMYCQAIEMSAPHEILANLLRIRSGQRYVVSPFFDLGRSKKGKLFSYVPPSAKRKLAWVRELAESVGYGELASTLTRIFHDGVRNAFSHSDYVLTDAAFRFTEGGLAREIEVADLDNLIGEAFAFYGAFMMLGKHWLYRLSSLPRYHKWPKYEVLEILKEGNAVRGFSVHFSNGQKATYSRGPGGTEARNLRFEEDGGIGFFVGALEDLQPVWKIDGVPVEDWERNDSEVQD